VKVSLRADFMSVMRYRRLRRRRRTTWRGSWSGGRISEAWAKWEGKEEVMDRRGGVHDFMKL